MILYIFCVTVFLKSDNMNIGPSKIFLYVSSSCLIMSSLSTLLFSFSFFLCSIFIFPVFLDYFYLTIVLISYKLCFLYLCMQYLPFSLHIINSTRNSLVILQNQGRFSYLFVHFFSLLLFQYFYLLLFFSCRYISICSISCIVQNCILGMTTPALKHISLYRMRIHG